MAKVQILDASGNKKSEIETNIFAGPIREDVVQKIVECEKVWQPYAPFFQAGQQTSASGNVRHTRHSWKSDRGRGMARAPKKRMTRRGNRFHWVGAVVPSARGGRRAHEPKLIRRIRKINKKELIAGLKSALAMTANAELIKKKYARLKDKEITVPVVVDSKILSLKTKEFLASIKKILAGAGAVALKSKTIRAGKGTLRGRKYKQNAGALVVVGKDEEKKVQGIDILKSNEVTVTDLASNGARITIFTENAVKELGEKLK